MIKNLKLAFLNIHMNIKNAKELKISFIISILGMILNNISFLILWYYFGKSVGIINGWEPTDIFGLYGISGIVGIILSAVGRSQAVREGGKTGLGTAGIIIGIINVILL